MLEIDQSLLGDWAVENEMKVNPGKSKAVCCTIARVQDPLNQSFGYQKFRKQAVLNIYELSEAETEAGLIQLIAQYKKPERHFIS